jgi:hypothetical protein
MEGGSQIFVGNFERAGDPIAVVGEDIVSEA